MGHCMCSASGPQITSRRPGRVGSLSPDSRRPGPEAATAELGQEQTSKTCEPDLERFGQDERERALRFAGMVLSQLEHDFRATTSFKLLLAT
jgi:hypothetical protein